MLRATSFARARNPETIHVSIGWSQTSRTWSVLPTGSHSAARKEGTPQTRYASDEPQKHRAKSKKPDTKDHRLDDFTYIKCPRKAKLIEIESKSAVVTGWGRERGRPGRALGEVLGEEMARKLEDGDDHTTLPI